MSSQPILSIIIPVFNEERTIVQVMHALHAALPNAEMIFVDDGSDDQSLALMRQNARAQDIVLTKENGGKGSAVRAGIEHVHGTWCVIQDADLEYDPREIQVLLASAERQPGTIIFGSRFLCENPNIYRLYLIGNKVLTWFVNLLFWSHLTDSYTCYKLFPSDILRALPLQARGFELEAELTAYPLAQGYTIHEVPIRYAPRTFDEGKKIQGRDAWRGITTMAKIWWKERRQ